MNWIKRNLWFVCGGAVALLLMLGAGYYTWTRLDRNATAREELNAAYEELKRLNNLNPHPGDGKKVDNIKLARQQQAELRAFLEKAAGRIERIAPIPDMGTNLTRAEYASALRLTVAQLQRDATNNSVVLPPNYSFSFEAQRQRAFEVANLTGLATQLGEVKAICDILNRAKINSLLSIRRERVSQEDNAGPPTDYLNVPSETNELAVLTPYEISFQSFGAELAAVIAGFANSPHGILVKSVNVRPAAIGPMLDPSGFAVTPQPFTQPYFQPQPRPGMDPRLARGPGEMSESEQFRQRYGTGPGGGSSADAFRQRYGTGGGKDSLMSRYQQPVAPPPVAPVAAAPTGAAPRGGLQPMLDERQLDVTIVVRIVKLLPRN